MPASMKRRQFLFGVGSLALLTPSVAFPAVKPSDKAVLLVVDVQNCFLPGGTLAVSGGNEIIPIINALAQKFKNVIFTQDWHTPGHASFASSHPGKTPFETIELPYGKQVLWPDHCIQGSEDAKLAAGLNIPHAQLIIRKGYHNDIDSYSTFIAADRKTKTGLTGYVQERGRSICMRASHGFLCQLVCNRCSTRRPTCFGNRRRLPGH